MKKWEDKVQDKTINLWKHHKVGLLIFILIVPFLIQVTFSLGNILSSVESWSFRFPDSSNWIGFWGSYLGVIPTGLIAYMVARIQIVEQKKDDRKQRNEELYLNDLKKLYSLLNDLSALKVTLETIEYHNSISGNLIKSEKLASMYHQSMTRNGNKYNYHELIKQIVLSFPCGNPDDLVKIAINFCQSLSSANVNVLDRIQKGFTLTDDAFSEQFYEDSREIQQDYDKLITMIIGEIKKYYYITD